MLDRWGPHVTVAAVAGRHRDGIVRTPWLTLDALRACPGRHRSSPVRRCVEDAEAGRSLPLETVSADPTVRAPRDGR